MNGGLTAKSGQFLYCLAPALGGRVVETVRTAGPPVNVELNADPARRGTSNSLDIQRAVIDELFNSDFG